MYKWARLGIASRNRAFFGTFLFLFTISVCRGVLVNRTIDNKFGDPVTGFVPIYQPQSLWAGSDQNCSICDIQPDTSKAFDGTWNWALYTSDEPGVNITLRFTGVAIWVFFILSDFNNIIYAANTLVNITLDGKYAGNFSHLTNMNMNLTYNATIFSTTGLTNTSHELVIGTNDYPNYSYLNFDWAIYTVDLEASASQNASSASVAFLSSTSSSSTATPTLQVVFPSTTSSSSTASTTPTLQSSSSKMGVIVGCTLGGLAVITLILVFLVPHLRRASPVRNGKVEEILDIDVPPRHQPYRKREIPVSDHEPTQSKAARLREARQRELDERIQSAQHEWGNLRSLRNARSADEIGNLSAVGLSQRSPELAPLRNQIQQLRDRVAYLQAQRESDWALGLSNEPLPPAYT